MVWLEWRSWILISDRLTVFCSRRLVEGNSGRRVYSARNVDARYGGLSLIQNRRDVNDVRRGTDTLSRKKKTCEDGCVGLCEEQSL
jgi:hypothetical protein